VPSWYATEAGRARLAHDRRIVEDLQPGLRHEERDGAMHLVGEIVVRTESGIPLRVPLQIDFPGDYPSAEPRARDITSRFTHDSDHHFIDNAFCLWLGIESRYRSNDPDGLRAILTEVGVQVLRLLVWESEPQGGYPGPARPHGPSAYAEIVGEALGVHESIAMRMWRALEGSVGRNGRCPCGSGVRYRHCHLERVARFRAAHSMEEMRVLVEILRSLALRLPFPFAKGAAR
jgi:hypothetical protein